MGPDKAQVTFLDVSAYFSEEEWKLLQEWQKDLYSNVMKEIHQALISLGPIITNSVVSKRAREKQEVYPLDNQESAQGVSATDTILSVSVKEETEPYCMDHENTEYISNPSGHDDKNMSFLIKDEEEAYSIDQQESSCATTGYENISFSEKDEEDAYSIHHQGNPRKRSLRVPSGNGSMTRQSQTGEMMQCMKINEQCKDSMEGKLSAVHQSFYRRTDSSSVLQSESFPEMSGEIASQYMAAETAGVPSGGNSGTTMASLHNPERDSFFAELSLLENEAAGPMPSRDMLQSLRLALEDEGQEEGCEAVAAGTSQSRDMEAPSGPGASLPVQPSQAAGEEVPLGTSWTWRYFRLPEGVASAREATSVVCTLCDAEVKRGRPGKSGMGTSALASHLAHRHRITKGQGPALPSTGSTAAARTTTAAARTTTTAAAARTTTAAARTTTAAGKPTTIAAAIASGATPTTSFQCHSQQTCMEGCNAGFMQVCQHYGETVSCDETLLEAVVGAMKRHTRRHHPEMARQYSASNRHLREGKGGKKRGREDDGGDSAQ